MSKKTGDRYERRLVNFFADAGYMVMRSPSSGSATTRAQPDVFALRDGERVAFEVKYEGSAEGIVYLDAEEVDALERFAEVADAVPMVAVRWKRDGAFYLLDVDDLERTDGGDGDNYRVTRERREHADVVLADPEVKRGHGRTVAAVEKTGVLG